MVWLWNPSGFSMTKQKHAVLVERGTFPSHSLFSVIILCLCLRLQMCRDEGLMLGS